jgi:Tfp pilus assembly protein PilE
MTSRRRRGFSLFDLLVIIAVLAILIGLLLPAVQKVREAAARVKCQNNLKQVALACHQFHDAFNYMPKNPDTIDKTTGTTQYFLLPYVEQQAVYKAGAEAYGTTVPVYRCPSDGTTTGTDKYGPGNYPTNNLLFDQRPKLPASFPDGTSNTIMFAEKFAKCSYWAMTKGKQAPWYVATESSGFQVTPANPNCNLPQSAHYGVINVAMGDGSVRSVSRSLSAKTWYAANTPAGGEQLGAGDYQDWGQ